MNLTAKLLGANIKAHRKDAGLTQEQLASQLHISFQTISKWENGKAVPDALVLPVLANVFSCSIDDLFSYRLRNQVYYSIPNEFLVLWRLAEKQRLKMEKHMAGKEGKQIIAMLSPCDRAIHMFVNQADSQDEKDALQELSLNVGKVDRIICMWLDGEVDLPSYTFRKGLLEIDPENKNAQILLMGMNGFTMRSLDSTMK